MGGPEESTPVDPVPSRTNPLSAQPESAGYRRIMLKSRELLLKFCHDSRYSLSEARITYVDRGAPDDVSIIDGSAIRSLEPFAMEIDSGGRVKAIPYHRITRILYQGKLVWEKGR